MNGIIIGAGRIGYNLATLLAEKHDITIIDNNHETCKLVKDKLDCYVIQGTGTNTKILEDANIKTTDFFVAVTPNDEVNLLSSVYAKEHNIKTIIARVNNPDHNNIFKKLDVPVINPETSAVRYISRNIVRPTAQNLVSIGKGTAEILELTVRNKNLINIPIEQIISTDYYMIITIYSKDKVIIPTNNTKLEYEDSIAVIVKRDYIQKIKKFFTST